MTNLRKLYSQKPTNHLSYKYLTCVTEGDIDLGKLAGNIRHAVNFNDLLQCRRPTRTGWQCTQVGILKSSPKTKERKGESGEGEVKTPKDGLIVPKAY